MTLTTHAVVGAALASAFNLNPASAVVTGFVSHFLLDRLPHWDYKLSSAKFDEQNSSIIVDWPINRQALGDFLKIGFDGLLGLALALIFFTANGQTDWLSILWGAGGGVLPDALQFIYLKTRFKSLAKLQRFHLLTMHCPIKITDPRHGLFDQGLILFFALLLGNWFFFI